MADSAQIHLRYAQYSTNLGSVPSSFEIPHNILALTSRQIEGHDFSLEDEIVIKADAKKAEEALKTQAEEEKKEQDRQKDLAAMQDQEKKEKEEKESKMKEELLARAKELSTLDSAQPTLAEEKPSEDAQNEKDEEPLIQFDQPTVIPAPVTGGTSSIPVPTATATATATNNSSLDVLNMPAVAISPPQPEIAAKPDHDTIVNLMVERTKQDKDVCYFYLESMDWNLENAIELLNSMQAR